jgi:adenylate kinase family enzyme
VVGTSGSGKSRLGAAAARRLGIPHLQLDSIHHLAGWQQAPDQEFLAALDRFVTGPGRDGWVIDGNYQSRTGHLEPDLVVWLDHPRGLVMAQLVGRTLRRGVRREELWNGNRERPRTWLSRDPEQNIVLWAWVTHGRYRAGYEAAMAAAAVPWVRLSGRRAVRRWLDGLGPGPSA